MNVSYYGYDWELGAQNSGQMLSVILSAEPAVVIDAWKSDFYNKLSEYKTTLTNIDDIEVEAFARYQGFKNCRSMSVGDIMKIGDVYILVRPIGFVKLDITE